MTDLLGNTIEPGDKIAYPGRRGSSCYMNVATVLERYGLDQLKVQRVATSRWGGVDAKPVIVGCLNRIVVVEKGVKA